MFTSSYLRITAILFFAVWLPSASAQRMGGVTPTGTNSAPPSNNPISNLNSLYVWGRVQLENGAPPPEPIPIERVCNGGSRVEGYTNLKGEFEFQLGHTYEIQDTTSNLDNVQSSRPINTNTALGRLKQFDYANCELRASLAGYQSTTVLVRSDGGSPQLNAGTILLRRLGNVAGSTISLTSMMAPKEARKAYEKAEKDTDNQKFDSAQKELNKAVQLYPHFAAAWSLLGDVDGKLNLLDEAKKAYSAAVTADPEFVKPYFGLAVIALNQKDWPEAARLTDKVQKLNAYAYPAAYLFNAAANFYLGNLDLAEQSARKFASMDTGHHRPDVALLLGDILAAKHDYAGAVQQLKDYLASYPNDPHAASIRESEKHLEEMMSNKTDSPESNK